MSRTTVLWFRRDLRLRDHPALTAAAREGEVVALFVLDPALLAPAGAPRRAFLFATLRALREQLRARQSDLVVLEGDPRSVLPRVARQLGASSVHVTADFGPYGHRRDAGVAAALGDLPLVPSGSPYAVDPDRLLRPDGSAFKVYGPFFRAWLSHGWPPALPGPPSRCFVPAVRLGELASRPLPPDPDLPRGLVLPAAGEAEARQAWGRFAEHRLSSYGSDRDRPDRDATSALSPHLKVGALHPRTLLAELDRSDDEFMRQLAWREFYAAVLFAWPQSARRSWRQEAAGLRWATGRTAARRFDAWAAGLTGYPIIDAGMRQLLATGWMHNRVRMLTASFLVKDLHLDWRRGARHFMAHLIDGDLASNQHGWQWVAGTGTDAAPFFRIFNPTVQAKRFDPHGDYVRRFVPELSEVPTRVVHEPWLAGERVAGYPARLVDHDEERRRVLAELAARKGRVARRTPAR